jgi:adenylate kinase
VTPPVIALAGLSGVGKSTLLARLSSAVPMQILHASALIKDARTSMDGGPRTLDALREADLDENQRLLVQGFASRVNPTAPLVALDCHTVIETDNGLVFIDPRVFSAMDVKALVFLEDAPEEIARRRQNDATRQRPATAVRHLESVQMEAIRHARAIATSLNIPLHIHRPAGEDDAVTQRLCSYRAPHGV